MESVKQCPTDFGSGSVVRTCLLSRFFGIIRTLLRRLGQVHDLPPRGLRQLTEHGLEYHELQAAVNSFS